MSYSDPDIQEAPINLVGLQMVNQEHLDSYPGYSIMDPAALLNDKGDIDLQIFCKLYLTDDFISTHANATPYIYMTAITDSQQSVYLSQQYGPLPIDVGNFMEYTFHIQISSELIEKYRVHQFRLIGSVTSHPQRTAGIAESLRIGRFFNTIVPIRKRGESHATGIAITK